MANDESASKQSSELRKRAEKALPKQAPENLESTEHCHEEMLRLIHELQVHQIELEMQNDELRRTQLDLEATRDKYTDLYDFAPVGYFTISEQGLIEEANLTAADLFCTDRQSLIGQHLTRFISRGDQDTFYYHHKQVLKKMVI